MYIFNIPPFKFKVIQWGRTYQPSEFISHGQKSKRGNWFGEDVYILVKSRNMLNHETFV